MQGMVKNYNNSTCYFDISFSLPLPLSIEDNNALAQIIPDTAGLGIWLDVVVSKTNEYQDEFGKLLDYVGDLKSIQGIGKNIILVNNQ